MGCNAGFHKSGHTSSRVADANGCIFKTFAGFCLQRACDCQTTRGAVACIVLYDDIGFAVIGISSQINGPKVLPPAGPVLRR